MSGWRIVPVEAVVREYKQDQSIIGLPGDWAGATVLIIPKPKE